VEGCGRGGGRERVEGLSARTLVWGYDHPHDSGLGTR
jgi:hypothetical protein